MKREIEPIRVTDVKVLWQEIVNKTDVNPDLILPVEMVEPNENVRLGSFYASFVREGAKRYLQLENFDSPEWAEMFLQIYEGDWEVCLGGIYRLRLDNAST